MTKGLVRANNFSDLADKDEAVVNLGLSAADYAALKGLYTTAGIDFAVIGEIGNSQGNYQAQLDGISTTLSGVVLSGYANRSGDTILGTWTHSGIINISSGLPSGYPASTDSLFSLSIESGEAVIVASGLIASGLSYNGVRQSSSTVQRAFPPSGFSPLHLIPLQVGGQSFFAEAGESPSFYIDPVGQGHALDLVTGNLVGTFSSASPAYAVNAQGILALPAANAPVIEYDPVTLRPLGLRVWQGVTNLCLRSEEIDNAGAWVNGGVTVTANDAVAPSNQSSAETISVIAPGVDFIYQIIPCSASTVYTWSFYVKLGTLSAADFKFAIRDDSNNAFIAQDISPSVTLSTSTWQRVTYTFTTPAGCVLVRPYIYRFGPSATGTFFAWGAQLNTGSTVGPYVPTTTITASSTADVITITGGDFARIYNQAAGTMHADASGSGAGPSIVARATATAGNRIQVGTGAGGQSAVVDGGNIQYISPAGLGKRALAFAANDFAQSIAGQAADVDTSGTVPSTDYITIGRYDFGGGEFLNGYIRKLALFRSRRPNANLQALTS